MVKISLRDMTIKDLELILAWRNHPESLKGSYLARDRKFLTWEEHFEYWFNRPKTWKVFIIQLNNGVLTRDVGVLQFGATELWRPEVGIYTGEIGLWGQGVAKEAIKLGLEWLKLQGKHRLSATVLMDNERSIRLFESLGFKRIGEARPGEWAYDLNF